MSLSSISLFVLVFFFFKQKTAYEMRISDWSSDVCSSDLMSVIPTIAPFLLPQLLPKLRREKPELKLYLREETSHAAIESLRQGHVDCVLLALPFACGDMDSEMLFKDPLFVAFPKDDPRDPPAHILPEAIRSEEHTSELQSLMRIS